MGKSTPIVTVAVAPPELTAPSDAALTGDVASAPTGEGSPVQYAQAVQDSTTDATDAKEIGKVVSLQGQATAIRADGTTVQLKVGDPVFQGDVIQTGASTKIGIAFVDGSVFSMDDNAHIVLDELVYNPGGQGNSMVFNLVEGSFVFVAGQIAPTGEMVIKTPVAAVGIRGTILPISCSNGCRFELLSETNEQDETVQGEYVLYRTSLTGDILDEIATVDSTDGVWTITRSDPNDPTSPITLSTTAKTPADLLQNEAAVDVLKTVISQAQAQGFPVTTQAATVDTNTQSDSDEGNTEPGDQNPDDAGEQQSDPAGKDQSGGLDTQGDSNLVQGTDLAADTLAGETATTQTTEAGTPGATAGPGVTTPVTNEAESGAENPPPAEVPPDEPGEEPPDNVNVAPVAVADTDTIVEDAVPDTVNGNVLTNDTDVDNAPTDLSVTDVDGNAANVGVALAGAFGTLTLNADGSYVYQVDNANATVNALNTGDQLQDQFAYTVSDGNGGIDSTTLTITIDGADDEPPPNEAPVAVPDTDTIVEDAVPDTVNGNVLTNDTDVDNVPADLSVTDVDGNAANVGVALAGAFGTLTLNADGSYVYQLDNANPAVNALNASDQLQDQFTYTVSDGNGGIDSTTLTITIDGANDAPVAVVDTDTIVEDAVPDTVNGNVLTNDTDVDNVPADLSVTEVNGNAANVGVVLAGTFGTLTLNADGSYVYQLDNANPAVNALNASDQLQDQFTYTVSDGNGGIDSTTLTITIDGATDAGLFTPNNDIVDFNTVVAGSYADGTQFDALGGDDVVTLPADAAEAAEAGYTIGTPFDGGAGDDTFIGGSLNDTIIGGDDVDTIDYSAIGNGVNVNLATGQATDIGGSDVGTDTLIEVENVIGSAQNDIITGDSGNNVLNGGAGNDTIDGGTGLNTFIGGAGNDTLIGGTRGQSGDTNVRAVDFNIANYRDATGPITVSLSGAIGTGLSTVVGDASVGTDTLFQIEAVQGTDFDDIFVVDGTFEAQFGSLAVIRPGDGDDTITGNGNTRVGYNDALGSVTVDLGAGTAFSTDAGDAANIGFDTFTGVNRAEGSSFNDFLFGSNGLGNEAFRGREGDDYIDGRGGDQDLADYRNSPGGVLVDLSQTFTSTLNPGGPQVALAQDGFGGTDELVNIEWVRGSEFNDTIIGNDGANLLRGSHGDDTLEGRGGDDDIRGDEGFDTAIFSGSVFDYGFVFDGVDWIVTDTDPNDGDDGEDTLRGVEQAVFTDGTVLLDGSNNAPFAPEDAIVELPTDNPAIDLNIPAPIDVDPGDAALLTVTITNVPSFGEVRLGAAFGSGLVIVNDVLTVAQLQSLTYTAPAAGIGGPEQLSYTVTDPQNATDQASITFTVFNPATAGDLILTGAAGNDTLIGADGDDDLIGNDGDDVLEGGAGINFFFGGAGDDTLIGGTRGDNSADANFASYRDATGGITVNLTGGLGTGLSTVTGDASVGTDTLVDVDQLFGTDFDDTYTVDASFRGQFGNFNEFQPGAGDDTITSTFDSFTRIGYSDALDSVTVDLEAQTAQSTNAGDTANIGFDTFTGVSSVRGSAHDDVLLGSNRLSGSEQFRGQGGNDFIDGRAGVRDEADYRNSPFGVFADLSGGAIGSGFVDDGWADPLDTAGTGTGFFRDTLVNIERVRGSEFDDEIIMDDGDNRVRGQKGDDIIDGGGGADDLTGGAGNDYIDGGVGDSDIAVYSNAPGGISVDLSTLVASTLNPGGPLVALAQDGHGDTDELVNIEEIRGSDFADTITGDSGENFLRGGAGDDTLDGGAGDDNLVGDAGNDYIDGGAGDFDIAQYFSSPGGISVDLSTLVVSTLNPGGPLVALAQDGHGNTDELVNIEQIGGSDFADTITGDGGNNFLRGEGGDDTLDGGAGDDNLVGDAGNDYIDGGAGDFDHVDYINSPGGISVDLSTLVASTLNPGGPLVALAQDGHGNTDELVNIEEISGSDFADTITGDGGNNFLRGEGGGDTLDGGAGDDDLLGNAGSDYIDGGAGDFDRADYRDSPGGISVDLSTLVASTLNPGGPLVALAQDGHGNTDELVNIEQIDGSDFADIITGDSGNNFLGGRAGGDTINGGLGDDDLFGDAGSDIISGGGGEDFLFGGLDQDTLTGGADADTFVFKQGEGALSLATADVITDFIVGTDTIEIQGLVFGDLTIGTSGLDATIFDNVNNQFIAVVQNQAGGIGAGDFIFTSDPIIVDLGAEGIDLVGSGDGVVFDLNADGAAERIAWTAGEDGLLAVDLDASGAIENGSEIFTPDFNGGGFADAMEALASLDGNADGTIDATDDAFDDLLIWVDVNHDGISQPNELTTLADNGIASINLGVTEVDYEIEGQQIVAEGLIGLEDGGTLDYVAAEFDIAPLADDNSATSSPVPARRTVDAQVSNGQMVFTLIAAALTADFISALEFSLPASAAIDPAQVTAALGTGETVAVEVEVGGVPDSETVTLVLPDGVVTEGKSLQVSLDGGDVVGAGLVIEAGGLRFSAIFDDEGTVDGEVEVGADGTGFATAIEELAVDREIIGTDDDDILIGGDGDDILLGGAGDDVLIGGAGDDILDGGTGENTLTGGEGADTFVLADLDIADIITDYSYDEGDEVDISALLDAASESTNVADNLDNYVRITAQEGTDEASLEVDTAGGGDDFSEVAVLQGVGAGDVVRVSLDDSDVCCSTDVITV